MKRCRKMISLIMLVVMLATLTPFQALAADIPTNGTDETITTVTEPQNEGQEGQKGQEDQTGQGTEDQGTGSDEGKGTDASGDNTQNRTDAGDQTPSGNEGTDSQTVGQDPVNNRDENIPADGQNTTDPNATDPNTTDANAKGSDPVEKGGNRAVAAEDITVTADTDPAATEYAYKDEVTLSATAESENADFNPENVTWQWQKRNENADDESAWTDIDGANESSYSFAYDETNWDQVYRAVATYEEVEKASDTVTITPKHSDEYVIDSSGETTVIRMDTEYNILDDVTVSPEYDAVTRLPVKVRIKSVECENDTPDYFDSSRDFTQPNILRAYSKDSQGHTRAQATYTVIYEAYVEDEGGTVTVLTPTSGETVEFETFDDSLVGDDSTGKDVAFIKNLEITEVVDGSPDIVTAGASAGGWDSEDGPGYDTGPHNGVVRTFDTVTYDLTFQSETYPDGAYRVYKQGRVGFELMIPGTDQEIMFNEGSMAWLMSTDANYKIIENVDADGQKWQVMRGDFMWKSGGEDDTPIGAGMNSVTASYRVLQMKNEGTVQPRFTLWLVGNEVPGKDAELSDMAADNYEMVYGAEKCTNEHHQNASNEGKEAASVVPDPILVSAFPWIDADLRAGAYDKVHKVYDFSTGTENALNRDAGQVDGRDACFGVTLRMRRPDSGKGLKGIEFPDPTKPITIDVTLDVSFKGVTSDQDVKTYADLTEDYQPLAWAVGVNKFNAGKVEAYSGREVAWYWMNGGTHPANSNPTYDYAMTGPAGEWTSTQNGNRISLEVNDFVIDTDHNPWRTIEQINNNLYDPAAYSNFWEQPQFSFTCAQLWVVQPFNNNKTGEYILEDLGLAEGDFTWTVKDVNIQCTGFSGQTVGDGVNDNSAQTVTTNDRIKETLHVNSPGRIESFISYRPYKSAKDESLTPGCALNGKDWTVKGSGLRIASLIEHVDNPELDARMAVGDELLKFDDEFFNPESVVYYSVNEMSEAADKGLVNIYFAAKPDGSGWTDDEEMKITTPDDLVYYASLEAIPDGVACIGVLLEYRAVTNPSYKNRIVAGIYVDGQCKTTAESNGVYMVTHCSYAWRVSEVKNMVADDLGIDVGSVTDDQINAYFKAGKFPSHYAGPGELGACYEDESGVRTTAYPEKAYLYKQWKLHDGSVNTASLDYEKSYYDESGFAGGGIPADRKYGDSCLVVPHTSSIIIQVEQGPNGSLEPGPVNDAAYSMDLDQRYADFVIFPTIEIPNLQLEAGQETVLKTDVLINVTIPKGLNYIDGTCVYDGTYTPPATHGKSSGTVVGGDAFTEGGQYDIAVSTDSVGNTILELTVHDVEIDWSKEEYLQGVASLPPIHYACSIGAPGTDHDVKNNQQFMTPATIHTTQDHRDIKTENNNIDSCTIAVSRQSALSILDQAKQNCVDIQQSSEGDMATFGFTKTTRNDAETPCVDAVIVSHVPSASNNSTFANEDARVEMTSYTLDLSTFEGMPKVYYSTNEEDRTKKDHKISDINDSTRWTEITVNEDGSVNLPEGVDITALAIVGTVPGMTTARMGATYDLINATPNDMIYDSLSMKEMEVFARSFVVSRSLSGRAWLDANKDGLYQKGERLFEGVTVTLYKMDDSGEYQLYTINRGPETDITDENGEYSFHVLPEGTFKVVFSDDRIGADEDGLYKYELTLKDAMENSRDTYDSDAVEDPENSFMIDGITLPPTEEIVVQDFTSPHHDVGVIMKDVEVTKEWDDADDQDGYRLTADAFKGKIKLYGNNSEISGHTPEVTVDEEDDSKYLISYKDLPWYQANDNGERAEIVYEVEETVPDHYTCEETRVEDGGTLVNKHVPEVVEIPVRKIWNDDNDRDGIQPESVTINLKADTEVIDSTVLSSKNQWSDSFTNLPKYKNHGTAIAYTVEEATTDVITGTDGPGTYAISVTGDAENGFTVTNTHTPEKIEIPVTKVWADDDNRDGVQPASVTINLKVDTEVIDSTVLSSQNQWSDSFTDLPKNKDHGTEIAYTVEEATSDAITGTDGPGTYAISYSGDKTSGFVVTNTHTPSTIDIPVEKKWNGTEEQNTLLMPESITVKLMAYGDVADTVELSEENEWKHTFTDLPEYKHGEVGKKIVYTIQEVKADGYTAGVITGSVEDGFTVTNTPYEPVEVTLEVTKELKGRDWETDDSFEFVLANTDDDPMPEAGGETVTVTKNEPTGKFGTIEFLKKGNYHYTIKETKKDLDGVRYDTTEKPVEVIVTEDAATGKLKAECKYSNASSLTVTNVFTPITQQLEVTKVLKGREWTTDDSFKFTLTAETEGAPVPEDNTVTVTKDSPTGKFSPMTFKKAGDYEYTITEVDEGLGGVTYDVTEHTVIVHVTKDEDNKLSAAVEYETDKGLIITNVYDAEGTATFEAFKQLNGRKLKEGEFNFILKDSKGEVIEKVPNDAEGKAVFTAIGYKLSEDKDKLPIQYTIEEEIPEEKLGGVTYSESVMKINVFFTDNGDGTLDVVTVYSELENQTFVNDYASAGELPITAKKELTGRKLAAGQFSAELVDEEGKVLQTVQNDENGVFTFEPLTYTQDEFKTEEGYAESVERNYTVREVDEGKPGYIYDKTEFPIHVVLTDDQAGKISVDTSAQEMEFVFRNEYKAKGDIQIKAQKLYNGGKLEDGMFTFCLYDQDGKLIEKVKNDATGDVTFAAIAVDETVFANGETDAVKTYTVNEEKPLFPKKGVT